MYKINKKFKIFLITVVIILISFVSYYIYATDYESDVFLDEDVSNNNVMSNTNEEKNSLKNQEEKNIIVVHIAGYVKNPGLVKLRENSRISDAIEKAGGLKEEADISNLNLAYLLEDGIKIYIPSHTEIEEEKNMESKTDNSDAYITKNIDNKNSQEKNSNKNNNSKININSANQTDLETLPGVGSATALKIISYRIENGKFSSIEDIQNVKGIGKNKFDAIKDFICVK